MNDQHTSKALSNDKKNVLEQKELWKKTLQKMKDGAAEENKKYKEKKQVQSELKESVEVIF